MVADERITRQGIVFKWEGELRTNRSASKSLSVPALIGWNRGTRGKSLFHFLTWTPPPRRDGALAGLGDWFFCALLPTRESGGYLPGTLLLNPVISGRQSDRSTRCCGRVAPSQRVWIISWAAVRKWTMAASSWWIRECPSVRGVGTTEWCQVISG